jgi:diguanylate cyclase (GGDEF)-like protein
MHTLEHRAPYIAARSDQTHLTQALLTVCADILLQPNSRSAVQQVCDELVEQVPAIQLVWTWFGAANTPVIRPQTIAGAAAIYAHSLTIDAAQLSPISPAFNALQGRKGAPYPVNEHAVYESWRNAARSHGIRSVFAVPLAAPHAEQVGVMVLYAAQSDYFERMGTGLFEALGYFTGAILNKQNRERALEHLAFYDSLTGQMNRNGLYKALETQAQSGYCVMIDIDHFKMVNDTYGHAVGDMVLSRLGNLIDRHTLKRRQLDENKHLDFYAARWGGEEFFIFIAKGTEAQVLGWVEYLRKALSLMECQLGRDKVIKVTASFGIALCQDSHQMLRTAIEQADAALYLAKATGRDCTVMYSQALWMPSANRDKALQINA